MKPLPYVTSFKTKVLTHLAYASRNSVYGNNPVTACVPVLLFDRCPSTIRFLVISIFIWKSIKAFSWRAFSHIFQKVFKTSPLTTNLYTTSSVHIEKLTVRVGASRHHVIPNAINSRSAFPMSSELFMHQFPTQTSTRQRISRLERVIPHFQYGAATANRYAARFLIFRASVRRGFSDYFKSSKYFSDKRDCFWHERLSFNFQRLCKRWVASFNWHSLRKSWQVNTACQTV